MGHVHSTKQKRRDFLAAESKNAALNEKFWFRHDSRYNTENLEVSKLSLKEIFFGNESLGVMGLLPMCLSCVEKEVSLGRCLPSTFALVRQYVDFCRKRVEGKLKTDATFMREFVKDHPEYMNDSIISQGIAYDFCHILVHDIENLTRSLTMLGQDETTNWTTCVPCQEKVGWDGKLSGTTSSGSFVSDGDITQKIADCDWLE